MSYRILLVDPDLASSAVNERALSATGYRTVAVNSFEEATSQIAVACPDLLVTAVRLGAFNGLHLLLRLRADHPDLPVIVAGSRVDLTPDVSRYGARFVTTPVDRATLVALASQLLAGRPPRDPDSGRRWPRKNAELPATVLDRSARVVELSYGGLRLRLPGSPARIHAPIDVYLPSLGLSVTAVPRWAKKADGGSWWCGAEVALAGSEDARDWRWIVDSLN